MPVWNPRFLLGLHGRASVRRLVSRIRMRGQFRMRQQSCNLSRVRAERDEQDPAGERKVLEEVPEQVTRTAAPRAPEVTRLPELLPKQRRDPAIARQDEGGEPVGHTRQDA